MVPLVCSSSLLRPLLRVLEADDHQSDAIDLVIDQAKKELSKTRYTDNAISFAFAQVGDDKSAIEFLSALDDNRVIGDMIDVGFLFLCYLTLLMYTIGHFKHRARDQGNPESNGQEIEQLASRMEKHEGFSQEGPTDLGYLVPHEEARRRHAQLVRCIRREEGV